jgi:hypothetical protein
MTAAPLPPGRIPDGAADDRKAEREHRLYASSVAQSQALARVRRQRAVERIHALGVRVVFELLQQLDRDHGLGADLDRQLGRFAKLDRALGQGAGGDRFPASPLRIVGGGR